MQDCSVPPRMPSQACPPAKAGQQFSKHANLPAFTTATLRNPALRHGLLSRQGNRSGSPFTCRRSPIIFPPLPPCPGISVGQSTAMASPMKKSKNIQSDASAAPVPVGLRSSANKAQDAAPHTGKWRRFLSTAHRRLLFSLRFSYLSICPASNYTAQANSFGSPFRWCCSAPPSPPTRFPPRIVLAFLPALLCPSPDGPVREGGRAYTLNSTSVIGAV